MGRETIRGDMGFLLGALSIFFISLHFLTEITIFQPPNNIGFALIFASAGFWLYMKQNKKYGDKATKAAQLTNPLALILGFIILIRFLISH